ncbi:MAG TPA: response regulator [Chthoniobacteraceae bacterium]|jgi:CheY-like chemotaxis protein|nr:response regulator [Chthoniobacteraceae bacterium]
MAEFERFRTAEILLIEDNPADVRLMEEAFKEIAVPHRLSVVTTGGGALQFLRRQDGMAGAPRPDLVLLDLMLPDMHGLEVLAAIKNDPALRRIPAVVFSSSQERGSVVEAYNLNANSYITKPVELADYIRVVKGVEEFWLTVVKLPRD